MKRQNSHSSTGDGQGHPPVGGDLDPQGQAVQRAGDVEPAVVGGDLAVGMAAGTRGSTGRGGRPTVPVMRKVTAHTSTRRRSSVRCSTSVMESGWGRVRSGASVRWPWSSGSD